MEKIEELIKKGFLIEFDKESHQFVVTPPEKEAMWKGQKFEGEKLSEAIEKVGAWFISEEEKLRRLKNAMAKKK